MLKIGVRLPRRFEDAGEYLADARALDAAGVDSLWLDDTGLDPWLVLAGIAAVTGRARLVAPVHAADALAPEAVGARVEALHRLSRGRAVLALVASGEGAGIAAIVATAAELRCCVLVHAAGARDAKRAAGIAGGLIVANELAPAVRSIVDGLPDERRSSLEVWATIDMPKDREHWRQTRAEYEAAGATGVIIPADVRLLDLIRNGDEEEDRSDLALAQG